MKETFIAIATFVICYLVVAFVQWEFDLSSLSVGSRLVIVFMWVFSFAFGIMIYHNEYKK